jgi:hypothetical protein
MHAYSPKLRDDLNLTPQASNRFATTIADEVRELPDEVLRKIRDEDEVGLYCRLVELEALGQFMEFVVKNKEKPDGVQSLNRMAFACQFYYGFVYFNDACCDRLRDSALADSTLRKCCTYLNNYPVRGFRNAVAHGNWRHTGDGKCVRIYYSKEKDPTKNRLEYPIPLVEVDFWTILARMTACVAFETIIERVGK